VQSEVCRCENRQFVIIAGIELVLDDRATSQRGVLLMANSRLSLAYSPSMNEPAQPLAFAEVPECQPIAQPAEYHERDDITR